MPVYTLTTPYPITIRDKTKILTHFPEWSANLTGEVSALSSRDMLAAQYLDYLNNYVTVEKWGEHGGLTIEEAHTLLAVCKSCYKNHHPDK